MHTFTSPNTGWISRRFEESALTIDPIQSENTQSQVGLQTEIFKKPQMTTINKQSEGLLSASASRTSSYSVSVYLIPCDQVGKSEGEKQAITLIKSANSLISDCKTNPAFSDLDTGIFLYRQILDKCSVTHFLYSTALAGLVSALGNRFMHSNQASDWEEVFKLCCKLAETYMVDKVTGKVCLLTSQQRYPLTTYTGSHFS